jgi:hypothetical protein
VKLVAGVDIGNSTTEIVVADPTVHPPRVVATERAPTRGHKGSSESGRAAALLLERICRREGFAVERAFLTPQRPVHTTRIDIPESPADLRPLTLLSAGASTPAGSGHGVGRPVSIDTDPARVPDGPVVLVASDPLGFRSSAAAVVRWQHARGGVAGLLLAGDEAALVAARVDRSLPIVDCVDAAAALACDLIALEVAAPGQLVSTLSDPLWLVDALGLEHHEKARASSAADLLRGHRDAVIGRLPRRSTNPLGATLDRGAVTLIDGAEVPLGDARAILLGSPLPSVSSVRTPAGPGVPVDDLWLIDLADAWDAPGVRAGSIRDRAIVVSSLASDPLTTVGPDAFRENWPGSVEVIIDEATASRHGALSTPGAGPQAWVLDLGGGTIDAIRPNGLSISAAGSGDLMTTATQHALGLSSGSAEWVKRGPASHVDAPHVLSDESGQRRFLDAAAPHGTVGWLVVSGPSGSLPFSRSLALAEWRSIRLALKRQVFADNVARILNSVPGTARPREVVVTGGPAGDDELLETLAPALPNATLGRARVAGTLDHRWAVAYGLVVAGTQAFA